MVVVAAAAEIQMNTAESPGRQVFLSVFQSYHALAFVFSSEVRLITLFYYDFVVPAYFLLRPGVNYQPPLTQTQRYIFSLWVCTCL